MGTVIGNIFALVLIAASALLGFISFQVSSITFICLAYGIWALIFLSNLFTRPSKNSPFCTILDQGEVEAYQRYHIHFWFPGAAQAQSALLNGLRIAGLVWGGLCIWNGMYWLGGASIAYFFVAGGLILKFNPYLYMSVQAQKGNQVAIEELSLIEGIQSKRAKFYSSNES